MAVKQKALVMAAVGQFGTGNAREWNFYNPFKKLYGLTRTNSDEYPQGKILKTALVNCLHRLKDEVNTWNLRNMQ